MSDVIQCAFTVDDNYCRHLAATIASLASNNRDHALRITILNEGLSSDNVTKLHALFRQFPNITADIKVLDASFMAHFPTQGFALAAYFRILLPDLLSEEVHRVLYLDSDLIVRHDIGDLWKIPLGTDLIAAVPDAATNIGQRLGLSPETVIFNSGVMLMDLDRWRAENVASKTISFVDKNPSLIKYVDQDALNVVLQGRVRYLTPDWNFQAWGIAGRSKDPIRSDLPLFAKNPHIVHF